VADSLLFCWPFLFGVSGGVFLFYGVVLLMKVMRSPFFWVSFAMCAGVMSTALISPLYGLYKREWSLLASDISVIYVIYMAGALSALLFLGQLSDRIGFRRVMQLSLVLVFLGTGLTMVAWDTLSLNARSPLLSG